MTGRVRAINPRPPFDHVEVDLQNAKLAEKEFGHRHQCELRPFAEDRAPGSEEEIFYQLLGNGRGSAGTIPFKIFAGGDLDFVPIEAMVLVEARVFRGDDSVLKVGRNLTERNKFVAFQVRRLVNPTLQATLDVHCSGRWVYPPGGQKQERGEQPEKRHTDDEPSNT